MKKLKKMLIIMNNKLKQKLIIYKIYPFNNKINKLNKQLIKYNKNLSNNKILNT